MEAQISSGTIDAPTWDVVRTAKTAARIYAPLGTQMRLGDWVRLVRTFVDAFSKDVGSTPRGGTHSEGWRDEDLPTPASERRAEDMADMEYDARVDQLASDLRVRKLPPHPSLSPSDTHPPFRNTKTVSTLLV
jgi:glycerol-3-phosphate O-acyltransferase / dihydroxyacetone phosphate acyltransferase